VQKPQHIFGRDAEWAGLASFATDARPGATLGVVSGRRRQGKSYLLQALAVSGSRLTVWALDGGNWTKVQVIDVPIQYDSSS